VSVQSLQRACLLLKNHQPLLCTYRTKKLGPIQGFSVEKYVKSQMQNLWQAAYNEVGNHHPVFSCHIFHICKAMYCTKDPNRRHKIIKYKQDHPTLWPLLKATVNYQLGKMQIGVTSIELKLGSSGFQSLHECQEWIYCHSTSDAAKNVHQLYTLHCPFEYKKRVQFQMLMSSKLLRLHTGLNFQHFISVSPPLYCSKKSHQEHLCASTPPKFTVCKVLVFSKL
jgi:hypothetical protein